MFEVSRTYPTALAAGPAQPDLALQTATKWVLNKQREVGGRVLAYAPGRQNIEQNQLLRAFCARSDVDVTTWKAGLSGWGGGPVLVAWPDRQKLAHIADQRGVRALCVVPWIEKDVDPWVTAAKPELLDGAAQARSLTVDDPVVVVALTHLTASVNQSNHLAGPYDKRDAVVTLTTLHRGRHALDPSAIYAWALTHGWPTAGAERLRELAGKISSGTNVRTGIHEPAWQPGRLKQWREEVEAESK